MRWLHPFRQLVLLAAIVAVVETGYLVTGAAPSALAGRVLEGSLPLFVVFWAVADAEERRRVPCYDFGRLLGVFFPLSVVWYVLWSRGRKGLPLLAGIVALLLAPAIIAALVGLAFSTISY